MKKILIVLFNILPSVFVSGQNEWKLAASVALQAMYSSRQESIKIKNTDYFYNVSEALRFQVPVLQTFNAEKARFFALLFKGNASFDQPFINSFEQQPYFLKLGAGFSAICSFEKKHHFLTTCKLLVSEDEQTISHPYYRTASTLLYNHPCTTHFSFSLGGFVSSNYKRVRILPLIGGRIALKRARLFMLFPLCLDLKYAPTSKLAIGSRLSPTGNLNRFHTSNYDASILLDKESMFRVRHLDLSAYLQLSLNRRFTVYLQGGWMFGGRMIVTTSAYTYRTALQGAPFACIRFHYRFLKFKNEEIIENINEEDLNLYYDSTPDDLTGY